MGVATVIKRIGSGQTYTTLAAWEADAPANYTTAKRWAGTFGGTSNFVQNEALTFTGSGATGKYLDGDNSTYITFSVTSGTPATGDVVSGATRTCTLTGSALDTGVIWRGEVNAATDNFTGSGNLLTIAGGTTSSTCYAELTTKTGVSFWENTDMTTNALKFNTSYGPYIKTAVGSGYHVIVDNSQNSTKISNLMISGDRTDHVRGIGSTANTITIEKCIVSTYANGGSQNCVVYLGSNGCIIANCLLVQRVASDNVIGIYNGASAYNCTFASPSDIGTGTGIVGNYGTKTITNCAVFGPTGSTDNSGSATLTATNCTTNDTTPSTGFTGSVAYSTATFTGVTAAAHDYRLVAGSALLDICTRVTGYEVDITGRTRTAGAGASDCGCWEYVAAGGGGITGPLVLGGHLIKQGPLVGGRLAL